MLNTWESYDRKNARLNVNKVIINSFSDRQDENIFVVPVYLNVDPLTDYTIIEKSLSDRNLTVKFDFVEDYLHFSVIGHQKVADVIFSYVKYFGTLT
jgi:hypothetical protein